MKITGFIIPVIIVLKSFSFADKPELKRIDDYTFKSNVNLTREINPRSGEGFINVVVEIPAGTNRKWEVNETGDTLKWDFENGKPRTVNYLPYPGNYGFVPRTIVPKESGGDGDPLDIILIGPAVERGSVVKARLIGVMMFLDRGEEDNKLIGIQGDEQLKNANSLNDLDKKYHGISLILKTWFENYKGPGKMEFKGFGSKEKADEILSKAIEYNEK